MGNIYYWIGAVIFWTVITSLTGTVLYLTWRWFKDNIWHRTWLFQIIDYLMVRKKYVVDKSKELSGSIVYIREAKIKHGLLKHVLKNKYLKLFEQIKLMNPQIMEDYYEKEKSTIEYIKGELSDKGWEELGTGTWTKEVDKIERLLPLYVAYVFQLVIDKKINKVKN